MLVLEYLNGGVYLCVWVGYGYRLLGWGFSSHIVDVMYGRGSVVIGEWIYYTYQCSLLGNRLLHTSFVD